MNHQSIQLLDVVALTEDLNEQLREIVAHVLETQNRVLAEVKRAIENAETR